MTNGHAKNDTPDRDLASLIGRARLPAALLRGQGMKKLDYIWAMESPRDFIAELATEELYWLIQDIGRTDSYALLEYATRDQLRGLVDIDAWHKHELELPRWLEWLDLTLAVDVDVALDFLRAQEDDLLEWLFVRDVEVHGIDLDTSTVDDEFELFESPDGMYYVTVPRDHILAERMPKLLRLLWAADIDRARVLFQTARFDLPSAVEASMEYFREARLADLGFVGPTEALDVFSYVPLKPLKREVREQLDEFADVRPLSRGETAFDLALVGVDAPELLGRAIALLDEEARLRVGLAITNLVNKVFMATTQDLSRTDELPSAGRHAAALANLGLSWLADEDEARAADILRKVGPETLFRAGHTLVFELALRARRVGKRAGVDAGFELFGAPTDQVLAGLSRQQPVLFEGLTTPGRLAHRPFTTLAELARAEIEVEDADALLSFFEATLGLSVEALEGPALAGLSDDARRRVQLSTLFRTGLANLLLTDTFSFEPLGRGELTAFARAAFTGANGLSERILAALAPLRADVPDVVARWVERVMEALRLEIGGVRPDDLDPRFTGDLFLVTGS